MGNPNVITIEVVGGSEPCKVDVNILHEILLQLPAEKHLDLYNMMKDRIDGKLYYSMELQESVTP